MSIVEENLEMLDPTPNIHQLFLEFDGKFFGGTLAANGRVAVEWSPRMTS